MPQRRDDDFSVTKEVGSVQKGESSVVHSSYLEDGSPRSLLRFAEMDDALLMIDFDNLNPGSIQKLQSPDADETVQCDRGHLTRVIDRVFRESGSLVAVVQLADGSNPVRLVGIEGPETALHPSASGALIDALREAVVRTQVIVTTHSPDLLDQINIETDTLLAAQMCDGDTKIAPIDGASRESIKECLYSPGALLAMDQLEPDQADLERQRHSRMFEFMEEPA